MNIYLKAVLFGLLIWAVSNGIFISLVIQEFFLIINCDFDFILESISLGVPPILAFIITSVSVYYFFKKVEINWKDSWRIGAMWLGIVLGIDLLVSFLGPREMFVFPVILIFDFPKSVIVLLLPLTKNISKVSSQKRKEAL